jgi:transposase
MTQAAEALPDDPETLKAMLIAERLRAKRLVAIIRDSQRHRSGRRAESLPEDQLLLALEDVEQGEAGEVEAAEAKSPTARGTNPQAAREPRRPAGASAAHRVGRRRRE